jgi:hypothetical protein
MIRHDKRVLHCWCIQIELLYKLKLYGLKRQYQCTWRYTTQVPKYKTSLKENLIKMIRIFFKKFLYLGIISYSSKWNLNQNKRNID